MGSNPARQNATVPIRVKFLWHFTHLKATLARNDHTKRFTSNMRVRTVLYDDTCYNICSTSRMTGTKLCIGHYVR